jgi:hypothetical protein
VKILFLILAGFCLPLYPLSALPSLLLQRRLRSGKDVPDQWDQGPVSKALLILVLPLAGALLVSLGLTGETAVDRRIGAVFAVWGAATSVLYALRLLTARDGEIWISHLFCSALALTWIGAAYGNSPLLPAFGLAVSLIPLVFLLNELTHRFGIARGGLYPGLVLRMPRFSYLFVAAVLAAVAVPFSPGFFAVAALAFGGAASDAALFLLPIGLSWVLWSWAGVNLLDGIVWGAAREDLIYRDLDRRTAVLLGGGLMGLGVFGIGLVEAAL